jgi:hypothetical protein
MGYGLDYQRLSSWESLWCFCWSILTVSCQGTDASVESNKLRKSSVGLGEKLLVNVTVFPSELTPSGIHGAMVFF